ncbi:MAG TPA: hypothetical protein VGN20_14400 [Mucilaginibacter sp.]|jgi:hypothetical protein
MKRLLFIITALFLSHLLTYAQDDTTQMTAEQMSKKRQDPVSGLRSIFLQDILVPIGEGNANSFSIQPVWPFKISKGIKLITYTIIPFQWVPPLYHTGNSISGLGNILFNGYFAPTHPLGKFTVGIGPAIQIPTRTAAGLASNRVSLGPTGLLNYAGNVFSSGIVLQHYWSLGGTGANKVNEFSAQYFVYYNLPKAWFLESNATIIANWLASSGNQWTVPLGGGPGKTFKLGKLFYVADAQLFYNAAKPELVGNWQAVFQIQIIL